MKSGSNKDTASGNVYSQDVAHGVAVTVFVYMRGIYLWLTTIFISYLHYGYISGMNFRWKLERIGIYEEPCRDFCSQINSYLRSCDILHGYDNKLTSVKCASYKVQRHENTLFVSFFEFIVLLREKCANRRLLISWKQCKKSYFRGFIFLKSWVQITSAETKEYLGIGEPCVRRPSPTHKNAILQNSFIYIF